MFVEHPDDDVTASLCSSVVLGIKLTAVWVLVGNAC